MRRIADCTSSLDFRILRHATLAIASVAAMTVASCVDPPTQSQVHVRVTGLRATLGSLAYDPTSYTIEVSFRERTATGVDAGADASRDAGADSGATCLEPPADASTTPPVAALRAIYWDHNDPFEFVVQIPAGNYGPPTVRVTALYECPPTGSGYREVTLGSGAACEGFVAGGASTTAVPSVTVVPNPDYCR